jgi:6-pyruvoyltetrahydropterin/6-carboxytetrahydropterin synthase
MDFGGLKAFKEWSEYMFDHTLVVAEDDPHLKLFQTMASLGKQDQGGVADLRVVEAVGCEKFSELAYKTMKNILRAFQAGNSWFLVAQDGTTLKEFQCRYPVGQGVKLRSVEVFEHEANSAIYEG